MTAFAQRGTPGGADRVSEPWTYLRDRLQEILGKVSQTLDDTAQALDGAAILALLPGQQQEKPTIGGPAVPAVLSSVQRALKLVAGQVDSAQQELVDCLK